MGTFQAIDTATLLYSLSGACYYMCLKDSFDVTEAITTKKSYLNMLKSFKTKKSNFPIICLAIKSNHKRNLVYNRNCGKYQSLKPTTHT